LKVYNRYMDKLKVALVHDYLVQYGGAEKTLEAIMDLFPNAVIYTALYNAKSMSKEINSREIIYPNNPFMRWFPKVFTFLLPLVFENFDLRKYDLIISDGTAWAKGVITNPGQLHVSYVHTPPRFLYGYSVESQKRNKWYFKPFVAVIDFLLRIWDFHAAQRPNFMLTNSFETKSRIKKFYKRDAKVIYPPVDVEHKGLKLTQPIKQPYYLVLGRMAAYKNFDLVVKAFNILGLRLVVAGTGAEEENLKKIAHHNITFTGKLTEDEKAMYLAGCLGVINAVEDEDLGIVPIEAMSYGKPVLAHRSGGHLETIIDGITGMFFDRITTDDFIKKFKEFDRKIADDGFDEDVIRGSVQKFSTQRFQDEFARYVTDKWEDMKRNA
jgi:glycosyltransferase involved in cell wall biosynthesis